MKCILVVDDSTTNLKFVEKVLKDTYKLALVKSGEQALKYLTKNSVDLILLDIMMPEMDGFETFQKIKELELEHDIPVMFFTADTDVEKEIQALAMGAVDFIRKPFVPEIMTNRINHILRLEDLTRNLEDKVEEKTKQIEQISFETIATIASMIEAKDSYTKGHSVRVAEYSALLAKELGWKEEEIQNLKYVALLHDIGKIGIPDQVLNKPGKLTEIEYNIIKSHTTIGGDILKDIETIPGVDAGARFHHERYDGTGYPSGIKGEDIPLMARIIGIADSYDAMNSKRVYRESLPTERIRSELVNGRGKQFDPNLIDVFVKLLDAGALELKESEEEKEKTVSGESSFLMKQIMNSMEEAKKADTPDYLTGLLSRKNGENKITEAMKNQPGCLAFLDLDNLKRTNDTMGHLAGDYALMTVGEVLASYGTNAVVARLGGDEFLYYMIGVDEKAAKQRIEDIMRSFEGKKAESTYLSVSSLSVGLCMTQPGDEYANVLLKADKALYHVKQRGKCGYYLYTSTQGTARPSSVDLEHLVSNLSAQGAYTGSLSVEYREFAKIYDFVRHLTERYKHKMQLMMITLQPEVPGSLYIDEKEQAMFCMEKTIQASLRSVDVCTRFSSEQFLVILMDAEKEDIDIIKNRIFENFSKIYKGKSLLLDYDVAELEK